MGLLALVYSVVAYALFFAAFLYLIVFVGGGVTGFAGAPKTLDWGPSPLSDAPAALVNICLLALFGLQHSIMARDSFKRATGKIIPKTVERSTYVLATVGALALLYVFWRPMPQVVWSVPPGVWSGVLTALFYAGFGLVLVTTFLINHFELFGLQQGWLRYRNKELPTPVFRTPSLYRYVRHPLYLGFIIAFWATPHMTVGHLLFAAVWTIYIFIAIGYEERDLIAVFGEKYRDYMAKTPMILPFGRRR
ncbi:methanethiol S-methyltransferase [Amphiplicatus metriothermophilus]|uniref:methanethiol S-methyltransferase n=1 Tax=Amphiplicatus metriothermophilus TaxID=1519374 RepID=A0A239PKG5_9PROT|nr:methanethiol S-methyltransferase [Amphiplicatus metriothermophilus]MBB5518122.1 protein-S-isoprenylcysteine O-methyltransferase Ste14 [Amphiplicatus metriothermophilus]SNT67544.1 Protein-S-isoprenylcysteine O-methyltransferase Ste14 [Amphiplicatus metriothermophilus]